MNIVINGNPVDGFVFTGPFADHDAALAWAEAANLPDSWHIATLADPDSSASSREGDTVEPYDNEQRADRAYEAAKVFMDATGTDIEDAVSDLICDLCHLAARWGQDPLHEIKRGLRHYVNERDYPPDGWAPDDQLPTVEIKTTRGRV